MPALNKLFASFGKKATAPSASGTDLPRPQPIDVTDADFAAIVETSDKLAVIDFWAEWCEPCRVMSAYVGFLAADYAGRILVAALDVDENTQTAERYHILGLPTLLFLRSGQEVDRIVGVAAYDAIQQRVDHWLSV